LTLYVRWTITFGLFGSFVFMVTYFVWWPGVLPVSTLTFIVPALPGGRTFGESTAVHPQLGSTDSIFSSALPSFLMTIDLASVLSVF
jgi:hypothetical protein